MFFTLFSTFKRDILAKLENFIKTGKFYLNVESIFRLRLYVTVNEF